MTDSSDATIARHKSGTAEENELNERISKAWAAVLSDANEKAAVAHLLDINETELEPTKVPFRAEMTASGLTGAEVLIALGVGYTLGFVKELGSAAGKKAAQRLRDVWTDYMRDRVSPPGSGKLGDLRDEDAG